MFEVISKDPVFFISFVAVLLITGGIAGVLAGLLGVGGGIVIVPVLFLLFPLLGVEPDIVMHLAVGTASAIGLIIALPGTITFILSGLGTPGLPSGSFGYLNILGFLSIVPATMMTAPIGARIAHAIDPSKLRLAFAFFLFLTSMRMFHVSLSG